MGGRGICKQAELHWEASQYLPSNKKSDDFQLGPSSLFLRRSCCQTLGDLLTVLKRSIDAFDGCIVLHHIL